MTPHVYKFGGASLSTIEKIKEAASFLKKEQSRLQEPIIVIVSAMGGTTDQLTNLARSVSENPRQREVDMLLTAGERISMSLMSLALNDLGVSAISLTGSQAGIITDTHHGNAQIVAVKPTRLAELLKTHQVIVLAGFQGVSKETKEVTTLGRGGSDTTAVAMAAHFGSPFCHFKKDVDGVYSADPKKIHGAHILPQLSHQNVYDMSIWGGKFIHYKAAALAKEMNVNLCFSHFDQKEKGTTVHAQVNDSPTKALAVTTHKNVTCTQINKKLFTDSESLRAWLMQSYDDNRYVMPQVLCILDEEHFHIYSVGDELQITTDVILQTTACSSITLIFASSPSAEQQKEFFKISHRHPSHFTGNTLTTFVKRDKTAELSSKLHQTFCR